MRSGEMACNKWCNSCSARLGALALMLACGGRGAGEGDGAEGEVPLDGDRGEAELARDEAPSSDADTPNVGAGGAGASEPDNIGNMGGAQFMVATRCDSCGWQRSEARCLDAVSAMPFVGDPAYYPCWDASFAFASCIEADAALCQNDGPADCSSERQALDLCF